MFAASKTASVSGGYQISRSLRFNSDDSAYLNRAIASTTNRTTFTWSGWIKRTTLGGQYVIYSAEQNGNNQFWVQWDGDAINVYDYQSAYNMRLVTTAVYRDPSAWYHIVISVDTTQATASNRIKLYVNGVQVTAFTIETYPSQNYTTMVSFTSAPSLLGSGVSPTRYLPGYMTEVNFIDGQALTASSFGETNADTGVWQPKAYSGSYGTNGFYLNFSDNSNTTAATLGKDYSGNGNNWTPNNFSVTAGAGNDSMVDVPTPYGVDTGAGGEVRGNYGTLNPLNKGTASSLTNGNLTFSSVSSTGSIEQAQITGTFAIPSSGKWYFEVTPTSLPVSIYIGVATVTHSMGSSPFSGTPIRAYRSSTGNKSNGGTDSAYGNTYTTSDVIGVAVDMDAGSIYFYKNNTIQNSGTAAFTDLAGTTWMPYCVAGSSGSTITGEFNFGQRAFAYTAPSGFKALCTQNLPTPTIGATTATQAGKFFNPVLYTGNNSTQSITTGFQPDFIWFKNRSGANNHALYDSVRGRALGLISNATNAEQSASAGYDLVSFDSNGFSLGPVEDFTSVNGASQSIVAWNWKANGSGSTNTAGSITSTVSANTTSGFSVATFTKTATTSETIGHGLGVAPSMIIVKARQTAGYNSWAVWHTSIGIGNYLELNTTAASQASSTIWNNTLPTSTVFSMGTAWTSTVDMVAYCFAPIAGYSAFGSYTGNGSADGPFVFTGMRPAFVLIKNTSASGYWVIFDVARNTYNAMTSQLWPNGNDAESNTYGVIDAVSNGFKLRNTAAGYNDNGSNYIYMALASNPFKYSLAR